MHVTTRPIDEPVALFEQVRCVQGEELPTRVLIFREGLLPDPVVTVLARLLSHV